MTELRDALNSLLEDWSLEEIVRAAIRDAEWCCEAGCGSGACYSCPCCSAGFCVSGRDFPVEGMTDEEWTHWLSVAVEHNALAPRLFALEAMLAHAAVEDRDYLSITALRGALPGPGVAK